MNKEELAKTLVFISQNLEQYSGGKVSNGFSGLQPMVFRRNDAHSNICVALLDEHNKPKCVLKFARDPLSNVAKNSIKREKEAMSALSSGQLAKYQPKLLGYNLDPAVVITEYVPGKELYEELHKDKSKAFINGIYAQSLDFLIKMKLPSYFEPKFIIKKFEPVLKSFQQHLPGQPQLYKLGQEAFEALKPAKLPSVLLHDEFNPYNIKIRDKGSICVLDWEDWQPAGLPGFDIFNYFLVYLRELSTEKENPALKAEMLQFINISHEYIDKYFKALNIDEKLGNALFRLFCIDKAAFFLSNKRNNPTYAASWLGYVRDKHWKDLFHQ